MAFLKHCGRTVCYRLLGINTRPLLVMAHPLGMTQGVWDDMLPALLGKFRVLTWDLPGHGASSAWTDDSCQITAEDLATEALALAAIAGEEAFHFVGTSIGGVIGQQLVSQHPTRLISATLTNTGAVIGTAEAWNTRSERVMTLGLATMAAEIVPRWFGPGICDQQPALVEGWRTSMGRGDARSYALLCEMLATCDFRATLGNLSTPLLLIGGTDDIATPPVLLEELARLCGASAPLILPQTGHVPAVECPNRFNEILVAHLT
ncbi:alpha/beta fold hydrolase [Marinobacter salicampi]|uniref:alpha/beta fold hydrolase n=1 Tax=Marinobacter salicampi TaxID=435907 RepID=UPI00140C0D0D|nr:alpha/beta fold hydrolase [Marinobacter salicampi]